MESGSVADWAMVAITLGGFVGAIWQLRLNLADSRAAREQAKLDSVAKHEAVARMVGIKSLWASGPEYPAEDGMWPVDVEVVNSGPYPLTGAVLFLPTDDEHTPMEIVYGTILPGERLKDTWEVQRTEVVFGELTGGATLYFTDAWDNHWSSSTSWEGLQRQAKAARIC